jgi:predicted metal-dependent phosphoesterase TrpH
MSEQKSGSNRLCSRKEAQLLMSLGWKAADLHLHTWCSSDVAPVEATDPLTIYHAARNAGCGFVTFTDHDTMAAYDRVGWTREGIVTGVEIKILDPKNVGHTLHVNVYDLTLKQFNELEDIAQKAQNIETFLHYLKEYQLCYSYNHPFWHEPDEIPCIYSIFNVAAQFPVVEYNMGRIGALNRQALLLAENNSSGLMATSDSHAGWNGSALTLAQGENFREYFKNISDGESYFVPQDMTVTGFSWEIIQRIRYILSKKKWLFNNPSFAIQTGIGVLDSLSASLIKSDVNRFKRVKKLLQVVLETVVISQIPSLLYIKSQHSLADEVAVLRRALTGNWDFRKLKISRTINTNPTGQEA